MTAPSPDALSRRPITVLGAGVIGLTCAVRLQESGYTTVHIVALDFPEPSETLLLADLVDPILKDVRVTENDEEAARQRRREKLVASYTSPWAGAHNRWIIPPPAPGPSDPPETCDARALRNQLEREHALSLRTFERMVHIAETHPEAGVTVCPGIEYVDVPGPEYLALTEERARGVFVAGDGDDSRASDGAGPLPGFRLLPPDQLPHGCRWGCTYTTWCVNPMVYCAWLLRRFVLRGGRVMRKEVASVEDVFALGLGVDAGGDHGLPVVVNCSGRGFGDEKMFVTRGQTVLVANSSQATVTRQLADGTWSFSVPRFFDGGTIVGGTKEVDDLELAPRRATRELLLRQFAATHPPTLTSGAVTGAAVSGDEAIPSSARDALVRAQADGMDGNRVGFSVIADIVGWRPTRKGGMRLETERLGNGSGVVVHAYGLGGRGYELSWGVAEEVLHHVGETTSLG